MCANTDFTLTHALAREDASLAEKLCKNYQKIEKNEKMGFMQKDLGLPLKFLGFNKKLASTSMSLKHRWIIEAQGGV